MGSLGVCISYPLGKQGGAQESTGLVLWGLLTLPVPFLCPESHFVYLEADKFSQEGQSYKLVSRPFCAPGAICVAFTYHMDGRGKGTKLRLQLGSPAGSPPSSLWEQVGSQGPAWLNESTTIPSGHQQPMQVRNGESLCVSVAVGLVRGMDGCGPGAQSDFEDGSLEEGRSRGYSVLPIRLSGRWEGQGPHGTVEARIRRHLGGRQTLCPESPRCQAFTSISLLFFSPSDLQLMFEVERGSHAAFIVALGFIFISQGSCRGETGPQAPERGPRFGMSST